MGPREKDENGVGALLCAACHAFLLRYPKATIVVLKEERQGVVRVPKQQPTKKEKERLEKYRLTAEEDLALKSEKAAKKAEKEAEQERSGKKKRVRTGERKRAKENKEKQKEKELKLEEEKQENMKVKFDEFDDKEMNEEEEID